MTSMPFESWAYREDSSYQITEAETATEKLSQNQEQEDGL